MKVVFTPDYTSHNYTPDEYNAVLDRLLDAWWWSRLYYSSDGLDTCGIFCRIWQAVREFFGCVNYADAERANGELLKFIHYGVVRGYDLAKIYRLAQKCLFQVAPEVQKALENPQTVQWELINYYASTTFRSYFWETYQTCQRDEDTAFGATYLALAEGAEDDATFVKYALQAAEPWCSESYTMKLTEMVNKRIEVACKQESWLKRLTNQCTHSLGDELCLKMGDRLMVAGEHAPAIAFYEKAKGGSLEKRLAAIDLDDTPKMLNAWYVKLFYEAGRYEEGRGMFSHWLNSSKADAYYKQAATLVLEAGKAPKDYAAALCILPPKACFLTQFGKDLMQQFTDTVKTLRDEEALPLIKKVLAHLEEIDTKGLLKTEGVCSASGELAIEVGSKLYAHYAALLVQAKQWEAASGAYLQAYCRSRKHPWGAGSIEIVDNKASSRDNHEKMCKIYQGLYHKSMA